MTLYCPGVKCVASRVAVAWVILLDVLPLINEAVPNVVSPELNVTVPVAGEPTPEALTVAASRNDCGVCCDTSTVLVAMLVIVKLMGVKSSLKLKLRSP